MEEFNGGEGISYPILETKGQKGGDLDDDLDRRGEVVDELEEVVGLLLRQLVLAEFPQPLLDLVMAQTLGVVSLEELGGDLVGVVVLVAVV